MLSLSVEAALVVQRLGRVLGQASAGASEKEVEERSATVAAALVSMSNSLLLCVSGLSHGNPGPALATKPWDLFGLAGCWGQLQQPPSVCLGRRTGPSAPPAGREGGTDGQLLSPLPWPLLLAAPAAAAARPCCSVCVCVCVCVCVSLPPLAMVREPNMKPRGRTLGRPSPGERRTACCRRCHCQLRCQLQQQPTLLLRVCHG
jgi:hypothetical protein